MVSDLRISTARPSLSYPIWILGTMTAQLRLRVVDPATETDQQWKLDERTRKLGLEGVARARAALAEARAPHRERSEDGGEATAA